MDLPVSVARLVSVVRLVPVVVYPPASNKDFPPSFSVPVVSVVPPAVPVVPAPAVLVLVGHPVRHPQPDAAFVAHRAFRPVSWPDF